MDGLIPKNFIADLLAKIDIVDIIGARLQLRKSGSNYTALCPFHNEKSPSFTVSQSKQFYHCFGCGAHGDAIGFLMQFNHMDFVEAVEALAAQNGMEIPRVIGNNNESKLDVLYDLLAKISDYYQKQLQKSKDAINYINSRKISPEIIQRFKIGYAPNDWHTLQRFATEPKTQEQLITAGILVKKEQKLYDRFRHRIMFPIIDHRGRTIGFGGRIIGNETPKYLNSPETPLFHKGNELYGLYQAKQANKDLPYIIIVEGYMDVIALAQYGVTSVVATLGTATTAKHIQKLMRYTKKIIFCFDGDNAGKTAGWRALENTMPLMYDGIQVAFMFLPENEDPDTQIRKEGVEAFKQRIENALPLSDFFFQQLQNGINIKSIDERAILAKKANDLLNKVQDGIFKQLMLEKLSQIIKINLSSPKKEHSIKTTQQIKSENKTIFPLVQQAIIILLNNTHLANLIEESQQIASMKLPNVDFLVRLIEALNQAPNITIGTLIENWPDKLEAQILSELAMKELLIAKTSLKHEFIGIINKMYEYASNQSIQELLQKAAQGEITTEEKYKLQKLIIDAKIKLKHLENNKDI